MNILQKAAVKLFRLKAAPFATGVTYELVNGVIISSPDNKKSYLTNGYNINDIIYSIVTLITEKVRVAPWGAYTVTDDKALKAYLGVMQKKDFNYAHAQELRRKALEPFDKDQRLNELLKYPNDTDTFPDLVANSSIYKLLTGDRLIWADLLKAGANTGKPMSLYCLPAQEISIVASRDFPMTILGYKFQSIGLQDVPKAQVMHDKYFNPNWDTAGTHLLGLAPMKAALALTDRSNSENKQATSAYQNGGPRSIIFVDEPNWDPGQKATHAAQIKRIITGKEYAGDNNANKLASSGYKMGVVPLGLSPVDLDIIESEKWSLRRFCNVFGGVPSQLLNDPDNKVYNNTIEGEKALTTRCAMPQLNSFRNQFNRKLGTDWGYAGKNVFIDYDMTVYSELQENMKDKWSWVERLPVPNGYKLDLMGLDHPEGEEEFMNEILVPSGYELSTTFGENETDRALANGNEEIPD